MFLFSYLKRQYLLFNNRILKIGDTEIVLDSAIIPCKLYPFFENLKQGWLLTKCTCGELGKLKLNNTNTLRYKCSKCFKTNILTTQHINVNTKCKCNNCSRTDYINIDVITDFIYDNEILNTLSYNYPICQVIKEKFKITDKFLELLMIQAIDTENPKMISYLLKIVSKNYMFTDNVYVDLDDYHKYL
jgi:DNA-directed RNA polymerase subunit RPC12/RpoP